jgi:hypothetical protein
MEEFSFEDADLVVRPMHTTPLPGLGGTRSATSAASLHPLPGTLFDGSPRPVASGVTRGERRRKQGFVWSMLGIQMKFVAERLEPWKTRSSAQRIPRSANIN